MKRAAAALLALALGACSTTKVSGVTPTTFEQITACRYVDDLVGTSAFYGVFGGSGIERARSEVLAKAQQLGANRVVWGDMTQGSSSTVTAKAYSCPA